MHVTTRVSHVKKARRESSLLKGFMELLGRLSPSIPELQNVFCTRLSLAPDCSTVFIYFHSPDGEEAVKKAIEVLKLYRPSMRTSLVALVSLRRTPDLRFFYDDKYEKLNKIERLLDEVKERDK